MCIAARTVAPAARPPRRLPVVAADSRGAARAPAAPPTQAATGFHPTALLDAACAVCCTVLLATSAARRLAQARETSAASQITSTGKAVQLVPPSPSSVPCSSAQCPTTLSTGGGVVGEAVLACVLLSAVSNLSYKLSCGGRGPDRHQSLALEAAAAQRGAEAAGAARAIDKLQVRTRLTSSDLRRPLAQLQASSAEHAALLSRLAGELEAQRGQVRDTQALLAALQGLTAKQFQVTVDAIKQLRSRQSG